MIKTIAEILIIISITLATVSLGVYVLKDSPGAKIGIENHLLGK